MAKKIIAVLLLAAIVLGGSGCMFQKTSTLSNKPSARETAAAVLAQRYGESFTFSKSQGSSLAGTSDLIFTCSDYPGQDIAVRVITNKSGDPTVLDNFVAVKYRDRAEALFREAFTATFGQVNIYHSASIDSLSGNMNSNTSFEAFYAESTTVISLIAELRESDFTSRQLMDQLVASLPASNGKLKITFLVIEDEAFGTMTRDELNKRISARDFVHCTYALVQGGHATYNELSGG